ncbi:hypothetical protein AC578_3651 [Pseudocercospora eumusae]|uniref:F-box domain-containing protein n=1 Tax=Pseudocercospora eumusae TaxID=321146 RepID=A0A139GV33_9PEZI|nr:hypothetical protein AC578_3651 [Pseudocercospora eumusae]
MDNTHKYSPDPAPAAVEIMPNIFCSSGALFPSSVFPSVDPLLLPSPSLRPHTSASPITSANFDEITSQQILLVPCRRQFELVRCTYNENTPFENDFADSRFTNKTLQASTTPCADYGQSGLEKDGRQEAVVGTAGSMKDIMDNISWRPLERLLPDISEGVFGAECEHFGEKLGWRCDARGQVLADALKVYSGPDEVFLPGQSRDYVASTNASQNWSMAIDFSLGSFHLLFLPFALIGWATMADVLKCRRISKYFQRLIDNEKNQVVWTKPGLTESRGSLLSFVADHIEYDTDAVDVADPTDEAMANSKATVYHIHMLHLQLRTHLIPRYNPLRRIALLEVLDDPTSLVDTKISASGFGTAIWDKASRRVLDPCIAQARCASLQTNRHTCVSAVPDNGIPVEELGYRVSDEHWAANCLSLVNVKGVTRREWMLSRFLGLFAMPRLPTPAGYAYIVRSAWAADLISTVVQGDKKLSFSEKAAVFEDLTICRSRALDNTAIKHLLGNLDLEGQ